MDAGLMALRIDKGVLTHRKELSLFQVLEEEPHAIAQGFSLNLLPG